MRFCKTWIINLSIALLVGTVCCGMRDRVVHSRVSYQIQSKFGENVTYGSARKKWFSPVVTIRDLKVYDQVEGARKLILDVPLVTFEYDKALLKKNQVFLKELRLEVTAVNLNSEGTFSPMFKKALSRSHFKNRKKAFVGIERLVISCPSVNIAAEDGTHHLTVGLENEVLENVRSIKDLQPIVARISRQNNWRNLGLALRTINEYRRSLGFGHG